MSVSEVRNAVGVEIPCNAEVRFGSEVRVETPCNALRLVRFARLGLRLRMSARLARFGLGTRLGLRLRANVGVEVRFGGLRPNAATKM